MKAITWALMVCGSVIAAGCGQKGPLYLPDKNASVVTSSGGSATAPSQPAPAATPSGQAPQQPLPQGTTPKQNKSDDDSQSSTSKPKG